MPPALAGDAPYADSSVLARDWVEQFARLDEDKRLPG